MKILKKIKKNRYEELEIYIKDITKHVFLKDLGFTYLHIYSIYNQIPVSNSPELLGYTYLRDLQIKNMKKIKKNRYERVELYRYIKVITKHVNFHSFGIFHIYSIYNQIQVYNPPEMLGYTY